MLVHGAFADGSWWNKVIPVLQLETEMAKNIKGKTYHLATSHVAMPAKPERVAEIILEAAGEK